MSMRAIIYCRVSSKEQMKNLSLPTQQKACIEYCEHQGFEVDKIFVEKGESAKTAERPEFQKMLCYCREKKGHIQFVVFFNVSRFARNTHDHLVIKALLGGYGIAIRSVTEPCDDSPFGQFAETVLAAAAQLDNDLKSLDTKIRMKNAMEKGRWPYGAPIGYLNTKDAIGSPTIIPDFRRASLIRKSFELMATGLYAERQVLKTVTNLGLRTKKGNEVSPQTFHKILRNPLYAKKMRSKITGEEISGNFEPIITEDLFNRVQAILEGKKLRVTPHLRNHPDFPLRRFVKCGKCGRAITGSWSKGRTKRYAHYRCPNPECKAVNITKIEFENRFVEYLTQLQPKEEYVRLFEAIVLDTWKEKQAQAFTLAKKLQQKTEELKKRREKLVDAFIYKELIDKATYQEQLDKINEEIALAEIEAHDAKLELLDIEVVLNFAQYVLLNASRLWMEMNLDQKQRLQRVLFPQGLQFLDGKFGTAVTCIAFNLLQPENGPSSKKGAVRLNPYNEG